MAVIDNDAALGAVHRLYRPGEAGADAALLVALQRRPLAVVRARPEGTGVGATLRPCVGGERLRLLTPAAAAEVRALSESVRFLPKWSWKLPQTEMLLKGFGSGRWRGMALLPPRGDQLVSYLDFALRSDRGPDQGPDRGEVEIGFCMTHPDWRGRGLISRLLGVLLLLHFDCDFRVSTHEANTPMARALRRFGFAVVEERPDDRINGETTLYLTRAAWTPFDLEG